MNAPKNSAPLLFDAETLNHPLPRDTDTSIPSVIKWTGSKRKLAHSIYELAPDYERYLEPFLGGGAVLYLAAHSGAVAGDVYRPLIEYFRLVRDAPKRVIGHYSNNWSTLQDNLPDHYYTVRERFNENPNPLDLSFLMRTCVNGIVRFNNDGEFNNSFHLSRKGMQPKRFARAVRKWNRRLQGVEFVCQDFRETVAGVDEGDFIYLDPPYAESTQRYTEEIELAELYEVLERMNEQDAHWALSFDGGRGDRDMVQEVPEELFERHLFVAGGKSPVSRVLDGEHKEVYESLYLNY